MNNILEVKNLVTCYGENRVIDGLSFSVKPGEIVMLVGSNGAGKSTLLKSIFGMVKANEGKVIVDGDEIVPSPTTMVEMGCGFVPQDFRIFPELTVEENLEIGAYVLNDKALIASRLDEVYKLFPSLKDDRRLLSSSLSGGQRQILALGRSMMLNPKLLLLDEPSVGLAPKIVSQVFEKIVEINEAHNTAVIIVEHNLKSLLKVADRALILYKGKVAKEGKPEELLKSKLLEEVFFGSLA